MSLLEMDFDTRVVTIQGDNGGFATIELAADEALELVEFFKQIHDEILKGDQDDSGDRIGSGSDGIGCDEGQDNRTGGGTLGHGDSDSSTDPRQLDLFRDAPKTGTPDHGTDGDNQ